MCTILNVAVALLFVAKSCDLQRLYTSLTPDNTANMRARPQQGEDVFTYPSSSEEVRVNPYYSQPRSDGFGGNYYFQYGGEEFDQQRPLLSSKYTTPKPPAPIVRGDYNYSNNITQPIPFDLLRKFDNFTNINDLLVNFVDGDFDDDDDDEPKLSSRFGGTERNAVVVPKLAACIPELKPVTLATSDDPSVLYFPSCTRVERCGGCCSHKLLSCQPTTTETISFQVIKTQFVPGKPKMQMVGKEIVQVDKHTKCSCQCKIKEQDCKPYQEYNKQTCLCQCTNKDEERKCGKDPAKLWNPQACACQCRRYQDCSTGYNWDPNQCACAPVLIRRRYVNSQREESYIPEVVPLVSLYKGQRRDN